MVGRGDRRGLQRGARSQRSRRRLYAPARLARIGADGRSARQHQAAPRHRRLALGQLFRRGARRTGIRLDIAPWRRPAPYTAPTESKAAGLYMICTLSKQHAEAAAINDALMFDWRGRVAEATGANAFFVTDGALHTPTPDCFLNGITRQTVIDLARSAASRSSSARSGRRSWKASSRCSSPARAAEVTPVARSARGTSRSANSPCSSQKDYDELVNGRIPNA